MNENELLTGESVPGSEEHDDAKLAADVVMPDKANCHASKKLAKKQAAAEQSEAYRKLLSEMTAQNTMNLNAYAAGITANVPSASQAVKDILAAYAMSAEGRMSEFVANRHR